MPLGTDIDDVAERLQAVAAGTRRGKETAGSIDVETMDTIASLTPPPVVAMASRAWPQLGAVPFNTVVTNVKGPPVPFYLCGAKMAHAFGMGPLSHGLGLFHTLLSYNGEITLSVLACPEVLPDLEAYIDCLGEELALLRSTAEAA